PTPLPTSSALGASRPARSRSSRLSAMPSASAVVSRLRFRRRPSEARIAASSAAHTSLGSSLGSVTSALRDAHAACARRGLGPLIAVLDGGDVELDAREILERQKVGPDRGELRQGLEVSVTPVAGVD